MDKLSVLSVFGTRPEAIKMAPLVLELAGRREVDSMVCVTAQHRQMLDSVLSTFDIEPDFDLDIMKERQTLGEITSRVLEGLGGVLRRCSPDLVLIHGDTTTTFAGALAAFYEKITVGHVEAGLRTWDKYSPFPEEMNRTLVGKVSSLHFAPTVTNAENLCREGITEGVFVTGNTVIDALKRTTSGPAPDIPALDVPEGRRIIAMTCHRRENYGEPMGNIFRAVRRLVSDFPDIEVIYPVHMSPEVRRAAQVTLGGVDRVRLIDPLDAVDMHRLLARCHIVMTDSGGIQEEAPALGKPVLVLRKETERPEAVAAGTVVLAGVDESRIYSLAAGLLSDPDKYNKMARAVNPYGDGRACIRIADAILWSFGLRSERPEEFLP